MSRLGAYPKEIPQGVEVIQNDGMLTVKGPKGELSRPLSPEVTLTIADGTVKVDPARDTLHARALWGTYASHLQNMFTGVTEGFQKQLEIEGVGYRATVEGKTLVVNAGYSHPVTLPIPEGIDATVEKNLITVTGIDKEVVGQFSANIRKVRPPEPYKGKGIHYVGEYIIRKQGKRAVA